MRDVINIEVGGEQSITFLPLPAVVGTWTGIGKVRRLVVEQTYK